MRKSLASALLAAGLIFSLAAPTPSAHADDKDSKANASHRNDEGRFSSDYGFPCIEWEGQRWGIRQQNETIGWSGPQAENPSNGQARWVQGARVNDQGDLVLRNEGINGGVEINAVDSMGYGKYKFVYSADFNAMDPHNVLGIFPYDMADMVLQRAGQDHQVADGWTEIDFIEISRWGQIDRALPHGAVTYYPDDNKRVRPERYNLPAFDVPAGHQTLTTVAEWREGYLRVVTSTADGNVLNDVTATTRVPKDTKTQQLRINLWTTAGNSQIIDGKPAYAHARADEVTFHQFKFVAEGQPEGDFNQAPGQRQTAQPKPEQPSTASQTPIKPSASPAASEQPTGQVSAPSESPTPAASEQPQAGEDSTPAWSRLFDSLVRRIGGLLHWLFG